MSDPSVVSWNANALRVTLFNIEPIPLDRLLFKQIFGTEPDIRELRSKETAFREIGSFRDTQASVSASPVRVDVTLQCAPPPQSPTAPDEMPSIDFAFGPYFDYADIFGEIVGDWIQNWDIPTNRIAYSGTLFAHAPTADEAYDILRQQVKLLKISPHMGDLIYRANLPVTTTLVKGGYLNRILTWSANRVSVVMGFQPKLSSNLYDEHMARMDFDLSSPLEDTDVLDSNRLGAIWSRMVDLVAENVRVGEVE